MRSLYVHDLMSSPVTTISPHTRLPAIKFLMRQRRIHRLPVVERGRLVGIVTLGDVRNAFPSYVQLPSSYEPHVLERIKAHDIMHAEVIIAAPHMPIAEAAKLMLQHRISGLPVVEHQQVVGIITKSDLCRAIIGGHFALAPVLPVRVEPAYSA